MTAILTDTRSTEQIADQVKHLRALRLLQKPPLTCPRCQEPCGYLYDANADGETLCLGCHIDDQMVAQQIAAYEAEEADRYWQPEPEHIAEVDRPASAGTPAFFPSLTDDADLACFLCGQPLTEAERQRIREMETASLGIASSCNAVCFACGEASLSE